MARPETELAEHVCLALVCEGSTHGWAVARLLAPDAEIGRIWTLSRPLTYRALEQLVADGLVGRKGSEPGRGRERTILAATPLGRRRARRWLDQPVGHVRQVRTELLVKLELRRRRGLDLVPLLEAQRAAFGPLLERLEGDERDEGGDGADLVALWRRENARTVARFLDAALE
ncbi:MAG TPA: PadR family transcriptional regulator, partial [Acidimicrobiales bacterium]